MVDSLRVLKETQDATVLRMTVLDQRLSSIESVLTDIHQRLGGSTSTMDTLHSVPETTVDTAGSSVLIQSSQTLSQSSQTMNRRSSTRRYSTVTGLMRI